MLRSRLIDFSKTHAYVQNREDIFCVVALAVSYTGALGITPSDVHPSRFVLKRMILRLIIKAATVYLIETLQIFIVIRATVRPQ